MDNTKELTHISLCTGYGGIDIGLSRTLGAVRSVAYVEIEAFPIINLVKKIEAGLMDSAPVFTDLKEFPWGLYRGKVDILSGGFPCQPFSAAGRRAGDEDPRHLWPFIVKGIRELGRPSLVFFENVEGIISSKLKGDSWRDPEGTSVLLHVLRELERLGYNATAGVFSAAEVGAPHQRKRVFILGVRDDLKQSGYDFIRTLLDQRTLADSSSNSGHSERASIHEDGGNLERRREGLQDERITSYSNFANASRLFTAYPATRGAEQYDWEPPRVTMVDTHSGRSQNVLHERQGSEGENREKETNGSVLSCASSRAEELGYSHDTRLERYQTQSRDEADERRQKKNQYDDSADSHRNGLQREIKSAMGRDINGPANWLDYAKLSESCDSRIEELRMLGNGVVPDTASRAFKALWGKLADSSSFSKR